MDRKKAFLILLASILMVSGASASFLVDGLENEPIDRNFKMNGINFNASYLNKAVNYRNVTTPGSIPVKKWRFSPTIKKNSQQVNFQFEYDTGKSQVPDYLEGRKVSEKIKISSKEVKGTLFNGTYIDDSGNKIAEVTAEAYYEHLVITYELYASNGTNMKNISEVYSDNETSQIPFASADTRHIVFPGQNVQEQKLVYDNRYEESTTTKVVVAYPNGDSLRSKGFQGTQVSVDYSNDVKPQLEDANLSSDVILGSESGYTFRAWNVSIGKDERKELSVKVNIEPGGKDRIYMWALGSAGGSTTLYSTGDFDVNNVSSNIGWREVDFKSSLSDGTILQVPYNNSVDGFQESSNSYNVPVAAYNKGLSTRGDSSNNTIGEVGSKTISDSSWTKISFQSSYNDPIVSISSVDYTDAGAYPTIKNISSDGFWAKIHVDPESDGEGGGSIANKQMSYIALEDEGAYRLKDGTKIEAWRWNNTGGFDSGGSPGWNGTEQYLAHSYEKDPTILHTVQTNVNSTIPRYTAMDEIGEKATQIANLTTAVPKKDLGDSLYELTGYIAIESDVQGENSGLKYESYFTPDEINGISSGGSLYKYRNSYSSTPLVIGSLQSIDGGNGGVIRQFERNSTHVNYTVEEAGDEGHTTEEAAFVAFNDSGTLSGYETGKTRRQWGDMFGGIKRLSDSSTNGYASWELENSVTSSDKYNLGFGAAVNVSAGTNESVNLNVDSVPNSLDFYFSPGKTIDSQYDLVDQEGDGSTENYVTVVGTTSTTIDSEHEVCPSKTIVVDAIDSATYDTSSNVEKTIWIEKGQIDQDANDGTQVVSQHTDDDINEPFDKVNSYTMKAGNCYHVGLDRGEFKDNKVAVYYDKSVGSTKLWESNGGNHNWLLSIVFGTLQIPQDVTVDDSTGTVKGYAEGLLDSGGLWRSGDVSGGLSSGTESISVGSNTKGMVAVATAHNAENLKPGIKNTTFVEDESRGVVRLNHTLDDGGEKDISEFKGSGTKNVFTNSSLSLDVGLPLSASYNVSDTKGAASSNVDVDLSKTETSINAREEYSHSLSNQRAEKTYNLTNNAGSSIWADIKLDMKGTVVQGLSWVFQVSSSSTESRTGVTESDWITNEDEGTYLVGENSSYSHDLGTQKIFNQTNLSVKNTRNFKFSSVDISSRCGITTSSDIASGTNQITQKCSNESYSSDYIVNQSKLFRINQNNSKNSDLSTQYLENHTDIELDNKKDFKFTSVDTSTASCSYNTSVDIPGGASDYNIKDCNLKEESSDWIEQEENTSVNYLDGKVFIGKKVDQNYTARMNLTARNNRSDISLSVDSDSKINPAKKCIVENSTQLSFSPGTTETKNIHQSCDPGDENGYTESKSETTDYIYYTYNGTFEVYTEITSEQETQYCQPVSRLDEFSSRDPSETSVEIDGISKDTKLEVKSINGAEQACIVAGDQRTNSSVHSGSHYGVLEYGVKKNTGSFGGSSGGGTSSDTKVVKNVSSEFSWTVSALNSQDKDFQFFGVAGRTETTPLVLENTGDKPVNLTVKCEATDGSCKYVEIEGGDRYSVQFDASSFTETTVDVKWTFPEDRKKDMNFDIVVTDPSYPENTDGKAEVSFKVTKSRIVGLFFERFSRLVDLVKVDALGGAKLPFFLIPFIPSMILFAGMRSVSDKRGGVLLGHSILTIAIFFVITGIVPPL